MKWVCNKKKKKKKVYSYIVGSKGEMLGGHQTLWGAEEKKRKKTRKLCVNVGCG